MALTSDATSQLAIAFPLRLEFNRPWLTVAIFLALGAIVVLLGMRSLGGLGPVRKWVAVGARLLVLALIFLILGNVKWVRTNDDVEVMVVRDISRSTELVRNFPGKNLQTALDDYLTAASAGDKIPDKKPGDKIGEISFNENAYIDALPNTTLALEARAVRGAGNGTDVAAAIRLALASMGRDARHRFLLIWDGNATEGDLDSALTAATAQGVHIDVMPLDYDVQNEVMVDKFVAPTWQHEGQPFTIDVMIRSTNLKTVKGKLSVTHNGKLMPLDGDKTTREITIKNGLNVERIPVPGQTAGVHQFHATVEGVENVTTSINGQPADTLADNNSADIFTFVRGKGQVLYVDNTDYPHPDEDHGKTLADALASQGINVVRIKPDAFPGNAVEMQGYDSVILSNVPRGTDGITDDQGNLLAAYIHDMGGGLVMIGGEVTYGAGGWQGTKLEEELPVNMEIPAQRQMPKGALVLIMHACEMPDGNYWGEQCALKAIETLSSRDEVGVITFGNFAGGSQFDYPLSEKGDGKKVADVIRNQMVMGDMPSFDDSLNAALNGRGNSKGLKDSDARAKHIIIVSDGDPAPPQQSLYDDLKKNKVTVSTVTVYPHMNGPGLLPPQMQDIAKKLGGRAYGPINDNPSQLPQIFIKEATVVRRSIIYEEKAGIPVQFKGAGDEMLKGLAATDFRPIFGMDLTSRKANPLIQLSLTAGKNGDPLFAHWQAGLGKVAAFTSDAYSRWAANWVGSPVYTKFWSQVVRGVSRAPMSTDFDIEMTTDGDVGHIVVRALNGENGFNNFVNIGGNIAAGPDLKNQPIRLVQTGPGEYRADFDAKQAGNYICYLTYTSPPDASGKPGPSGALTAGTVKNGSPELRDLKSNDQILKHIADVTGGRMLTPFEASSADLFGREGLPPTESPRPIWDILIPFLLGLILLDVAIRRIAWDWRAVKQLAAATATRVRQFTTTTRKVESRQTLESLKRVRDEVAEQKFKPAEEGALPPSQAAPAPRPDPKAKFQAGQGVEGDITKVVGGATDKPIPPAPKKIEPKGGAAGGSMGSLMEAKRRAQQKIKEKEQGDQK